MRNVITTKQSSEKPTMATIKKMTLMQLIEQVAELTEGKGLTLQAGSSGPVIVSDASIFLLEICSRLRMSSTEALMLCVFMDRCFCKSISYNDIAKHFDVRPVKILAISDSIDKLVERGIIIRRSMDEDGCTFFVPKSAWNSIRNGNMPEPVKYNDLNADELIDRIAELMQQCQTKAIDKREFTTCVTTIIESNSKLEVFERLNDKQLKTQDIILFLVMSVLFIVNRDDNIERRNFYRYFERYDLQQHVSELVPGTHALMQAGLIEHAFDEGQVNSNQWQLSNYAKREIFQELNLKVKSANSMALTKYETIAEKSLYFCDRVESKVGELRSLLEGDSMQDVQRELVASGMRIGFTCLFYGAPGTGKTETAQQLSRLSKRDIMLVDVPSIRSKWVGETEKNIKSVFNQYHRLAQENGHAPILLFNEADALLTRRSEGTNSSVDKMENAMQNIILQEMEHLNGIMIATTNLTGSLDPAFERRFLYKIKFEKPSPKERRHIWCNMLPCLTDEQATALATAYDFSGGQIENIARKQIINRILSGSKVQDYSKILEACDEELIVKNSRSIIGFG